MTHARIAALATIPLALALVAAPAVAAHADTADCGVRAELPSTLKIVSDDMSVPITVTADPGCLGWVNYDIVKSNGAEVGGVMWDGNTGTQRFNLFQSDGPGSYRATNGDGYDASSNEILPPDSNTMVAKYGAKLSWSAARSGSHVTLKATARRWSYTGGQYGLPGYARWKHVKVEFQAKVHGAWHTVKTVKANAKGVASVRLKSGTRTWRAVVATTGSVWGTHTGSHRK